MHSRIKTRWEKAYCRHQGTEMLLLEIGLRTVPYTNGYTVPCDGYGTRTIRSLSLALDGTVYGTD